MSTMRAKVRVSEVIHREGSEQLKFSAVTGGSPEDNNYSKWTPSALFDLQVTNPSLHGVFKPGQTFYVDFTECANG